MHEYFYARLTGWHDSQVKAYTYKKWYLYEKVEKYRLIQRSMHSVNRKSKNILHSKSAKWK